MSIQHVGAVLDNRDSRLSGTRKLVLITLANRSDAKGVCWPSQGLIAAECGIALRSVRDHLKALASDGFIARRTKRLGQGNGSRTTYKLNLEGLGLRPAESAGAKKDIRPADSDTCTGSTPPITNHQEPTLEISNDISFARERDEKKSANDVTVELVWNSEATASPEQPKPKPAKRTKAKAKGKKLTAYAGSRMSEDWEPPVDYINHAKGEGFSEAQVQGLVHQFRDYWLTKPGDSGISADWFATWRGYIRLQKARRDEERSKRHGPAPWKRNSRKNLASAKGQKILAGVSGYSIYSLEAAFIEAFEDGAFPNNPEAESLYRGLHDDSELEVGMTQTFLQSFAAEHGFQPFAPPDGERFNDDPDNTIDGQFNRSGIAAAGLIDGFEAPF